MCFDLLVHFVSTDRSTALNHKTPVICFVLLIFRTLACSLAVLRSLNFKVPISRPHHLLSLSFKFHGNHAYSDTNPSHAPPTPPDCIVNTKQEDTNVISLYFMLEVKLSGFKVKYKLLSFAHFFPVDLEEKLY